jgi:hypothetical protein
MRSPSVRNLIRASICALSAVAIFASNTALAQSTKFYERFDCRTDTPMHDGAHHTVSFLLADFDNPKKVDAVYDDNFMPAIKSAPQGSQLQFLFDNGRVQFTRDRLVIDGDADGFVLVKLHLYKTSNYTRGFVRVDDISGVTVDDYASIICRRQTVTNSQL